MSVWISKPKTMIAPTCGEQTISKIRRQNHKNKMTVPMVTCGYKKVREELLLLTVNFGITGKPLDDTPHNNMNSGVIEWIGDWFL